jgi:hypothetical protein
MQVVGNARLRSENFNGVSDKLKEELIKPLKPGDVIHLQLLKGSYDVTLKREVFGASRSIPLRDRIKDPYAREKMNGEGEIEYIPAYVEVGVPEPSEIKNGRVEKCKKFWVESIANGIPGNGQFDLFADSISDTEIYEFLCLCNGNRNNPYRDKSKEPLFEIVDSEGIMKAQAEKDFKELEARLKLFSKLNPEKAAELSGLIPKEKIEEVEQV